MGQSSVKAAATDQPESVCEFGPFRIDKTLGRLLRDGHPVPLTPKAFDVLLLLVENHGRLVEKEELLNRVWADSFVEEGNLKVTVSMLRKALEEGANGHRYIETVPRRGYRFAADVKEFLDDGRELVVRERTRSSITIEQEQIGGLQEQTAADIPVDHQTVRRLRLQAAAKTIAVLPFKSINRDASDEYLELGMADALITRLSNIHQIVVRPTSAVRRYTNLWQDPIEAGRQLQVESVLEGNIQRVSGRIRITVQLVSLEDGATLDFRQRDEFIAIGKAPDRRAIGNRGQVIRCQNVIRT